METFRKAPINNTVILINIVIFLAVEFTGGSQNTENMLKWGAMYIPFLVENHEYYRLFTSMFLHFGMAHLVNNMLVLFVMGGQLERAMGKLPYLLLYLIGGLGGNILSVWLDIEKGGYNISAGASGAVFAVMGGLFYVLLINRGKLEDFTTRKLTIVIALSMYFGFTSTGVDNAAHIGGLISGILLGLLLYRRHKS